MVAGVFPLLHLLAPHGAPRSSDAEKNELTEEYGRDKWPQEALSSLYDTNDVSPTLEKN